MNVVRLLARKGAKTSLRTNLTVVASTFVTLSSSPQSKAASVSRFGLFCMLTVITTSSAVIAVPSLHFAFLRILTVQVFESDEIDGMPSARSGTTFRFGSAWYRFGKMNPNARTEGTSPATNGLRLWASASSAQTSVPPFFMLSPEGVLVPQAETSTAIAATAVDTRTHRNLPIDRSMYVNYLPSRQ